jgi:tRNA-specific 2-thiouridylase
MAFPLSIPSELSAVVGPSTRVLVALSGGVDSSLALAMLHELGCETWAVTFRNFCYAESADDERACCSLDAIEAARAVARRYGARHWVADVTDRFRRSVIEPFLSEYIAGRTPNPCLACNQAVRFPELWRLASRLGCTLAATGHYARLAREARGTVRLRQGLDRRKDQSYFLHGIDRDLLPHLIFPLGWSRKEEIRKAARELQLPTAGRRESQEICFVPEGKRGPLFPEAASRPGPVVDSRGRELGQHCGLIHYTVGQRRGLGVAAGHPLYVLALDPTRNRLVVGERHELQMRRVHCDLLRVIAPDLDRCGPPAGVPGPWLARLRHRQRGIPVARWQAGAGELVVELAEPATGVAPGQALVLYHDDIVLAGGRIRGAATGRITCPTGTHATGTVLPVRKGNEP